MFAMIFRGVFLVAVLALYSTSLWKMIDGYFKDRFQNYLHEEFRKNPKMLDDLNAYTTRGSDKRESEFASAKNLLSAPQREASKSLASGPASVDVLATAASFSENVDHESSEPRGNRVAASVDNHAFRESHETPATRNTRPLKTTGNHGFQDQSALKKIGKQRQNEKNGRDAASHDSSGVGERRKKKMREEGEKKEKRIVESGSKKRKYSPITFTEDDFKSAKRLIIDDDDDADDFSEFDLNDESTKIEPHREGILVSELPFKPRFDIGDLEIVTADEFCPLTLEDEATCGITSKWP